MNTVEIKLHTERILFFIRVILFPFLMILPWLLSISLWLKVIASGVMIAAISPYFKRQNKVYALHFGHDGLSVAVKDKDCPENYRVLKACSIRVPRFFCRYIEMILELEDNRKITLFILPGICDKDAFRFLRKYLLQIKRDDMLERVNFLEKITSKRAIVS